MAKVSLDIDDKVLSKMKKVAQKRNCCYEDCIELAMVEYIDNFEDFYKTDMNTVSNDERSFFLSLGK